MALEAVKQRNRYIVNGGRYSIYDRLVWLIPNIVEPFLDVTIQFGANSYVKRYFAQSANVEVFISDVLGDMKQNPNIFLPLSETNVIMPTQVTLSTVTTFGALDVQFWAYNSRMTPDLFVDSRQFLTMQADDYVHDLRFETGLFHYGMRNILAQTAVGTYPFDSVGTGLSYVSLRDTLEPTALAATVVPLMLWLPSNATISNLPAEVPDTVQFWGDTDVFTYLGTEMVVFGNRFLAGFTLRDGANEIYSEVDFSSGYTLPDGRRLGVDVIRNVPVYASVGNWVYENRDAPLKFLNNGGVVVENENNTLLAHLANNNDGSNIYLQIF